MTEILVLEDPAAAAAERLAAAAGQGRHIVLAGGSTPLTAYERAVELDADWSAATLWFGDERCVPPDHEHSNYGMARAALLDRLEGPAPVTHRMEGERGPRAGAEHYGRLLGEAFGAGIPVLDLVLLGMGPDAHTASLFPDRPALDERTLPVVGVEEPGMEPLVPRVTLTIPTLAAAREILFLVSGADKAPAVARAFGAGSTPDAPAGVVAAAARGAVAVMLDPAAASHLEGRS